MSDICLISDGERRVHCFSEMMFCMVNGVVYCIKQFKMFGIKYYSVQYTWCMIKVYRLRFNFTLYKVRTMHVYCVLCTVYENLPIVQSKYFMAKAATVLADLLIPILQWTNTFPPCNIQS